MTQCLRSARTLQVPRPCLLRNPVGNTGLRRPRSSGRRWLRGLVRATCLILAITATLSIMLSLTTLTLSCSCRRLRFRLRSSLPFVALLVCALMLECCQLILMVLLSRSSFLNALFTLHYCLRKCVIKLLKNVTNA